MICLANHIKYVHTDYCMKIYMWFLFWSSVSCVRIRTCCTLKYDTYVKLSLSMPYPINQICSCSRLNHLWLWIYTIHLMLVIFPYAHVPCLPYSIVCWHFMGYYARTFNISSGLSKYIYVIQSKWLTWN